LLLECFEPHKQFFSYLAAVTITGDWTAKGLLKPKITGCGPVNGMKIKV
jgi:hypothetical protein